MRTLIKTLLFPILVLLSLTGASAQTGNPLVRLATTTSTENAGLLGALLPHFTRETGYEVHVIAVGTGKALRMGADGDVDVVLVHAPEAERRFVCEGNGVKRHPVMYNDFVIVGPKDDPAGVQHAANAAEALTKIQSNRQTFISRGDDSGTHKKERNLWRSAGLHPTGAWYREAGQGMGKVLQITDQMQGYTLTDRGTWLAYQDKTDLRIVFQGDPPLFNPYGIIRVSDRKYPDLNHEGAETLIRWITSAKTQQRIADFRKNGESLFIPNADKP